MLYSPASMLDLSAIRAIGLDLDDTLWPIWPTIERAELQLQRWLEPRAPITRIIFSKPDERLALRSDVLRGRPELGHDLSALRLECLREGLRRSDEDSSLAEAAFEVFLEHRMRVDLFDDALPALEFLASRYPVVAITNGNADLRRVGISAHFKASLSARHVGVAKPDPAIFHAAAAAVGVLAHQVLHIGDDPLLDVMGGLGAGMQTAWINRSGKAWSHPAAPHASVTDLGALCRLLEP